MGWGIRLFVVLVIMLVPTYAAWNPDVNDDDCVDQDDYDAVENVLGGTGESPRDVNDDNVIDQDDLDLITAYIDMGEPKAGCNGFTCEAEKCDGLDNDCDGVPDEDGSMCGDVQVCMSGECILVAGTCQDPDGNDIYTQARVVGVTDEDENIHQDEACYERDIYKKLRPINRCYGDECFLKEYTCNSRNKVVEEIVSCEYGCNFGKCRNITKTCIDYDSGLDIFVKSAGSIEIDGETVDLIDKCLDTDSDGVSDALQEYECLEEFDTSTNKLIESYEQFEITCDCQEGICKGVYNGACVDTDHDDPYIRGFTMGTFAEGTPAREFDFCMERSGASYDKIEQCTGEDCFIREFACQADNVVKYVHECPLGCYDGLCIGTECGRDEFFVLSKTSDLAYDDSCEIIGEVGYQNDIPSDAFISLRDFKCCSGSSESYCVHNGECYPSSRNSNYYEFDDEIVVCGCTDSDCSLSDGNHVGTWYDMDSSEDICEGGPSICNMNWYPVTGFKWTVPAIEGLGEYEDKSAECCGDDPGEYPACDENGECICCDSPNAVNNAGACGVSEEIEITAPTAKDEPKEPEEEPTTPTKEPEKTSISMKTIGLISAGTLILIALIILITLRAMKGKDYEEANAETDKEEQKTTEAEEKEDKSKEKENKDQQPDSKS